MTPSPWMIRRTGRNRFGHELARTPVANPQRRRLPRRQTRVLTWPVVTVFPFIVRPDAHFFLKPMVTRLAAQRYGEDFRYVSKPNWATYASLLHLAERVRRDLRDLRPRDHIDIQSFLWVQGSDEYP